jgi:SAM-dependent methyltransferase
VTDQTGARLVSILRERPRIKTWLKHAPNTIVYDTTDWVRVVMYRETFKFIERLGPRSLDVLEISGGSQWHEWFSFRSYLLTDYPEFDICKHTLGGRFDLIIADQVFEHLERPARAAANAYTMLRPDGHLIVATPFLVRIHRSPIDCSCWTPDGLVCLLEEAGFPKHLIRSDGSGSRACPKANLSRWRKRCSRSLRNEPQFPLMVWAFARKSREAQQV